MKKKNRILAAVITVLLILTLLPVNCFAADSASSEIAETPVITDLVIDTCVVYENIDGIFGYVFEDGFYYTFSPSFRLVLSDGRYFTSSIIAESSHGVVIDGVPYYLEFSDSQYDAPWGIGIHTVEATLLNKTVEFSVEVKENPVSKIEYKDTCVYENFNCYQDYLIDSETGDPIDIFNVYGYAVDATVYFKDGTKQDTVNGTITYNGRQHYIEFYDFQYEEPWSLGENTAYVSLFGIEQEITVTVENNPYVSVALDENLNLTLTRNDGGSEQYEVIDISPDMYLSDTMMFGKLITDKGAIPGAILAYTMPPETQVIIVFGEFMSEPVVCGFFGTQISAATLAIGAYGYRAYSEKYLDKVFTGYENSAADYDENALASMSILTFTEIYDYLQGVVEKNGNIFVVLSADIVKELVENTFGISGFDKTQLFGYDAAAGTAEVLLPVETYIVKDGDIQPSTDGFSVVVELYEAYLNSFDAIEMSFTENGEVISIGFEGDKTGLAIEKIEIAKEPTKRNYKIGESFNAINGAKGLEITAIYEDGSQKQIIGGFTFGEFLAETRGEAEIEVFYDGKAAAFSVKVLSGDANGDGAVNASDLAFVKKIMAGLEQPAADKLELADIDLSGGNPNAADLATLKKMIAGLEV